MRTRRNMMRTLLADLFFFAMLHSLFSVGTYIIYQDLYCGAWGLLFALPFALMTLARQYIPSAHTHAHGNYLFGILVPLPALLVFLLPLPTAGRVLALFAMAVCIVYSVLVRLYGPDKLSLLEPGQVTVCLIVNALLSFSAGFVGMSRAALFTDIWTALLLVFQLIYHHSNRVDLALDVLGDTKESRAKKVLKFNNGALLVFLLPVVGLLAFLAVGSFKRLDSFVMWGMGSALGRFLMRVQSIARPDMKPPPPTEPIAVPGVSAGVPPHGVWMQWLRNFYQIALWVLIVAAAVFLAAAALYALYRLYRRFGVVEGLDEESGDEQESLLPELEPEDLPNFLRSLRHVPTFGKSERDRVRRRYYQRIQRHIQRGVPIRHADTPREIAEKITPIDTEAQALTAEYMTARYSREEAATEA